MVEPGSGRVLPDGEWGELVVTTLGREAMPLVRYRTGDMGRVLDHACACGSRVRRLDKVRGRLDSMAWLDNGRSLWLADLDEALLDLPGIMDFRARLHAGSGPARLQLQLLAWPGLEDRTMSLARERLEALLQDVGLDVEAAAWSPELLSPGKRLLELGQEGPGA